jgi:hypothetical protein
VARVKLELGAELVTLTQGELDQSLGRAVETLREEQRGVKYRRIPQLTGTPSGGALDIGGDNNVGTQWSGNAVGPSQGWAWELGLVSVAGLTPGTTPDIVNLCITGAGSSLPWWQFNGNNFAYTFGRGELVLQPGERLRLVSVGTIAATGAITLFGSVRAQAPAEKLGRVTM